MADTPRMTVKEFRAQGYLQELNRMFLHPLGLALEILEHPDGTESFGEVWDYRDDPEGMVFGPGIIDAEKAERIRREADTKRDVRNRWLGYDIQPPPE